MLAPTFRPEVLGRAKVLSQDIAYILGTQDWRVHPIHAQMEKTPIPPLTTYIKRLRNLAANGGGDSRLLLAHSYVRYLGDLSGGQILCEVIAKSYNFPNNGNGVRFYHFYEGGKELAAGPSEIKALKEWFRAGMDSGVGGDEKLKCEWTSDRISSPSVAKSRLVVALVNEAILAFKLNQDLFTALRIPQWAEMSSPGRFELSLSAPPTPVTLLPPKSVFNSPHLSREVQASFLGRYLVVFVGLALLGFLEFFIAMK